MKCKRLVRGTTKSYVSRKNWGPNAASVSLSSMCKWTNQAPNQFINDLLEVDKSSSFVIRAVRKLNYDMMERCNWRRWSTRKRIKSFVVRLCYSLAHGRAKKIARTFADFSSFLPWLNDGRSMISISCFAPLRSWSRTKSAVIHARPRCRLGSSTEGKYCAHNCNIDEAKSWPHTECFTNF